MKTITMRIIVFCHNFENALTNAVLAICFILIFAVYGEWSHWSQCTVTCGQGTKRRHRQCNRRNSRYCTGNTDETVSCLSRQCQLGI